MAGKPVGWRKDPARHSLAARGVKTSTTTSRAMVIDKPPRWISIDEVKAASARGDKHVFDEDTMRFFDSRVESEALKVGNKAYFITSEQFHDEMHNYHGPRKYTVRVLDFNTGGIDSVTEFNKLDKDEAEAALAEYGKGG